MLVGRIVKELSETKRRTVDFKPLVDAGESIWIQSSKVILGNTGWSNQPFPAVPPADPTPLELQSITTINNATAVQVYVRGGTAGNVYTVQINVLGVTSLRIWTVEIGVQITGTVTAFPPSPALPSPANALAIGGGTMLGPLLLSEDPLSPGEAATKRYVDNYFGLFAADQASEAIARATEDTLLQNQVTGEVTRAEAAEAVNAAAINTEVTRATLLENSLSAGLSNEIVRAEAVEATLTSGLAAEIARAEAAEAVLTTAVTTGAASVSTETTRAEAAEAVLTSGLAAEVTARTNGDNTLTTNLAAEITRAEAAEAALTASIATLRAVSVGAGGSDTTDGTGHVRITFGTPFATACDAFLITVAGAGHYIISMVAQADRFGADVYSTNSATDAAIGPVGFYYVAYGH